MTLWAANDSCRLLLTLLRALGHLRGEGLWCRSCLMRAPASPHNPKVLGSNPSPATYTDRAGSFSQPFSFGVTRGAGGV